MDVTESVVATRDPAQGQLRATLSTGNIVFMVLATAAPMAAVIGVLPVAFGLGNGAGLPMTILGAGLVLWLFSVGYTAMSRRVVNAGAFYTYVVRGLGPTTGLGAAFLAVVSYAAFVCGAVGYFGYFAQAAMQDLVGRHIGWGWYSAAALLAIGLLGFRQIDFSSRLLGVLLTLEFGILATLAASIVLHSGTTAFPTASMNPASAASGHPGVALMFAFTCFIGFESAALYSEEARDARRSVARATYGSLVIITAFYVLMSWVTVGAVGAGSISKEAADTGGYLYFGLSDQYLTHWVTDAMEVLLATSIFATALALHNVASRYIFSLGRQRCLPRVLGATHSRHHSPYVASFSVTVMTSSVVAVCIAYGVPSLIGLGTSGVSLGTVGIIGLQAMASAAIYGYFRRFPSDLSLWPRAIAPILGCLGLGFAVFLAVQKFYLLSGSTNAWLNVGLPACLAGAVATGSAYANWMRRARPAQFAVLREALTENAAARPSDRPGEH